MAGTLDKTFGTDKQGWTASTFISGESSSGNSLVTDTSGNIFVTGYTRDDNGIEKLILAKYKSTGVLDTSFGTDGSTIGDFYGGKESVGSSLVTDTSGNIFVTGYTFDDNGIEKLILAKYTSTGVLDTNFGENGKGWNIGNFYGGKSSSGESLVVYDDGNIFVTGNTLDDNDIQRLLVVKYTSTGVLDLNFGTDNQGWTATNFIPGKSSSGKSLVVYDDGNIFVIGYTRDDNDIQRLLVAKYTKNGVLDTSFGTNKKGWTASTFNVKESFGNSIVVYGDGNIFVTGDASDDNDIRRLLVAKYTNKGVLDTNFGTDGGWTATTFILGTISYGSSLVLDGDGNIFVTGYVDIDDSALERQLLVAKYTSKGILDTSFGTSGKGWTVTTFYTGQASFGNALLLGVNGGIIVVGFTSNGIIVNDTRISQLLLAKYLNPNIEPICVPAGTPILTDQGTIPIDLIDPKKHTIANHRIVAITRAITPEKYLVCFEANSIGINCPSKRTLMTPGHEVLYKGKLVQAKHFIGRVDGVHSVPYNGKDVLYNVLQERHGLMKVNNMILETLHPENKVAKALLQ